MYERCQPHSTSIRGINTSFAVPNEMTIHIIVLTTTKRSLPKNSIKTIIVDIFESCLLAVRERLRDSKASFIFC